MALSSSLAQEAKQRPFKKGEKLKYIMHYGLINGGQASLELQQTNHKGKTVYYAKATGRTTGITDFIYNVYDVFESYFDTVTLLPITAIRNVKEGPRYKDYNEVNFFHKNAYLVSQKSGKKEMMMPVFDFVSAFYNMRKNKFEKLVKDTIITFQTYFEDDFYTLKIIYKGIKNIKTRLGYFDCHKFNPIVEAGRVFDTKEDVTIYISNDKNLVPIQVKMDILVGSFTADLIEYSGLPFPLEYSQKKSK